jgi:hypothetical protein
VKDGTHICPNYLVMHYSLFCEIGMLLFWCIRFNGAKTLFLAVQVCLLVSRTSGGWLGQFCYVLVMHKSSN